MRKLTAIAAVLTLMTLTIVGAARAGVYLNTIDPIALRLDEGREILVTGPLGCDAGETYTLRVEVTQTSTSAFAEGTTTGLCTGNREEVTFQPWLVRARTVSGTFLGLPFDEGDIHAEAWVETTLNGEVTDSRNWEVDIVLADGEEIFLPLLSAQ